MTANDAVEAWPDWPLTPEAMPDLARYVDPARAATLVPADAVRPWARRRDVGAARVTILYERLAERHIPYAYEPWNTIRDLDRSGVSYQRIRGFEEATRGPATCLDLALVFAGMCLAADLRPLVAVTYDGPPHARVLVDVREPLTDFAETTTLEQQGAARVTAFPGVIEARGLSTDVLSDAGWVAVDQVRAAVGPLSADYQGMTAALASDARYANASWHLVDVAYLRTRPAFVPFTEPYEAHWSPIHSYLPPTPSFREYPSREHDVAELRDAVRAAEAPPQVIVIRAPQGYGKSLLARQIAAAADHNAGWFLAADDRPTFVAALARAERTERAVAGADVGGRDEKPDQREDDSLAAVALARLRDALAPWVVVVDNADRSPDDPKGVLDNLPIPRAPRQTLIITTTHDDWVARAERLGPPWRCLDLGPLDPLADFAELELPGWCAAAVAGRPLVAESLSRLVAAGARGPGGEPLDGPALMWLMFREAAAPPTVAAARRLAWCPPEPVGTAAVPGAADGPDVCADLADARIVTPHGGATDEQVIMHRLVATAIRDETWATAPAEAADAVADFVLSEEGRALLLRASDETALRRLEEADVARAAELRPDRGLLWHAVGHIRERRGPVKMSGSHFDLALKSLDATADPYAVAESELGVARVTYQTEKEVPLFREAAARAARAVELLEASPDPTSRQLRAQATALGLLLEQKIAGKERDAARRLGRLLEIREGLWASYEERLRIARGDDATIVPGLPPTWADGLGSERAYYNLAGVGLAIARAAYEVDPADPRVDEALGESYRVYEIVRDLRAHRYGGRAHPHLSACIHGLGLVTYYRALYQRPGADLMAALLLANEALVQRFRIVHGLYGDTARALADGDVGKSVEFLLKLSVVIHAHRTGSASKSGIAAALRVVAEAVDEIENRTEAT